MAITISNVTHATPVAPSKGTPAPRATQPKPQPAVRPDTVQLTGPAQAALAALKETRETPAQTAKEANSGDLQAQRLLAREATAKSVTK